MTQVFKILTILIMCSISFSSIFGDSSILGKSTDKIGHRLDKIKEIDYKLSLNKIGAKLAAKKMVGHMKAIEKLNKKISINDPIKEFLISFLDK